MDTIFPLPGGGELRWKAHPACGQDTTRISHVHHGLPGATITLPYEFPSPGEYQIGVQTRPAAKC